MTTDAEKPAPAQPIVIKKYANRRLYNTGASTYVTLDHLSEMVRKGEDFVVLDAKTEEDITRSVLTQIIVEQEGKGQALLPVTFLRSLIRFYGNQMQTLLPAYLDASMESFTRGQDQMRERMSRTWGATPGLGQLGAGLPMEAFEEQAQRNMALFEQALRAWTGALAPGALNPGAMPGAAPPSGAPEAPKTEGEAEALADLKRQMELMQKQLEQLAASRKP
jgi:polyhydroxyalkanoate synthesis repressor PhaR